VYFDPDKLEKIITNLLTNAFKFTHKGTITIKIREIYQQNATVSRKVEITVEDTGIGIAEEQLQQIFNPFHQVDSSHTRRNEGTGLGLALAKNLVTLYQGEIKVSSQIGKGSCFVVTLPVEKEELKDHVLVRGNLYESPESAGIDEELTENKENADQGKKSAENEKPLLLIVEDNADMRHYISKILSQRYQVIQAIDGHDGLRMAFEHIPEIIISDVMMPGLSGIVLANTLKSDDRTNHIPVILLTALTSTGQKIEGLTSGADDYITKPFNEEILLVKVENLLANRKRMSAHLLSQFKTNVPEQFVRDIQPSPLHIENPDEKFIKKALEITEIHISEIEYGVTMLAREIGMESSTLYKKMMALLEMSPGEFIRDIRMKRAAQLIRQEQISIAEVSYMIGYDNPKYFSKVFKKHFGSSPSDYRAKALKQ
jgi:DNA-binding response OmpR family regulator/anti-sigma regulatory factor (Ser/Thr protein kinase)